MVVVYERWLEVLWVWETSIVMGSMRVITWRYCNAHICQATSLSPGGSGTRKSGIQEVNLLRFKIYQSQHYSDIIMGAMASQLTSLTIVYSNVYSGADKKKYQSSASVAFVRGIHRWPVNSPHQWPVTRKMFPFDDVIMRAKVGSMLQWLLVTNLINVLKFDTGNISFHENGSWLKVNVFLLICNAFSANGMLVVCGFPM